MLFHKIKGHRDLLSQFEKIIQDGTFKGSYLFQGPQSVGKMTVARTVGRYLTCTGLKDDSCQCENCRLFPNSPDYLEISRGDNTIVVDDVESLCEFLNLAPYRSQQRVAVIDNAENLNLAASNRLLKVLEESPGDPAILIVSKRPERLLKTLVSRCTPISFGRLSVEDVSEILKVQGHESSKIESLTTYIPRVQGNILLDFGRYYEYMKYTPKFLKDLSTMKEDQVALAVHEISDKQDTLIFLEMLLYTLNDILKFRYGAINEILNIKSLDVLEEISSVWKEDLCIYSIDRIRTIMQHLGRKVNLKEGQLVVPTVMWMYYFLKKSNGEKN